MNWLRRFMIGRSGPDTLNNYTLIAGFIISLAGGILGSRILNTLSTAMLAIVLFRMFSRNIYARRQENLKFLQLLYKIKSPFIKFKNRQEQKQIYKFYKCPTCKQELRVPKGKGLIKISCPKCGNKFQKRT